jgi:hypothetical protein
MNKTKLAVTLTTTALLAGQLAAQTTVGASGQAGTNTGTPAAPTSAAGLAALNRAEMRQQLAKIERSARPEPKMGAMCYEMASPPERAEYVCPTCGERTLYGHEQAALIEWELETCRRLFRQLPQRKTMTLDESSLCRKCRPDATVHELVLTIRFDDGTTNVVHGVTSDDLRLLAGALAGNLTGKTFDDGEEPLKEHLPRLRELLGEKSAK